MLYIDSRYELNSSQYIGNCLEKSTMSQWRQHWLDLYEDLSNVCRLFCTCLKNYTFARIGQVNRVVKACGLGAEGPKFDYGSKP